MYCRHRHARIRLVMVALEMQLIEARVAELIARLTSVIR